jgi:hypothetical protein
MTPAQEKTVARLKEGFLYHHSFGDESNYETKTFKLDLSAEVKSVSMVIEVGMINDEGTTAALICRDRAHFFIGPRGGIRMVDRDSNKYRAVPVSMFHAQLGHIPKKKRK